MYVCSLLQLLNILVHNLLGYRHSEHHEGIPGSTQEGSGSEAVDRIEEDGPLPPCCGHDPGAQLDRVQHMAEEMEQKEEEKTIAIEGEKGVSAQTTDPEAEEQKEMENEGDNENTNAETDEEQRERLSQAEAKKLSRMSLNTAVAIGLHNFPEGLATFVAALEDPKVGALLAIAIAIHNVPEGRFRSYMYQC